jgi:IMP dehydrogenase/GMP reductase
VHGSTIAESPLVRHCREGLVQKGLMDHSAEDPPVKNGGDRYAEDRDAMSKVDRSVERVDNPKKLVRSVMPTTFFGQKSSMGRMCAKHIDDTALATMIKLGHQVVPTLFGFSAMRRSEATAEDVSCLAGCFEGSEKK